MSCHTRNSTLTELSPGPRLSQTRFVKRKKRQFSTELGLLDRPGPTVNNLQIYVSFCRLSILPDLSNAVLTLELKSSWSMTTKFALNTARNSTSIPRRGQFTSSTNRNPKLRPTHCPWIFNFCVMYVLSTYCPSYIPAHRQFCFVIKIAYQY